MESLPAQIHFSTFNHTHGFGESSSGKRSGGKEEVGSRAIRNTGKQKRRCRGMEAPGPAGDGELSSV